VVVWRRHQYDHLIFFGFFSLETLYFAFFDLGDFAFFYNLAASSHRVIGFFHQDLRLPEHVTVNVSDVGVHQLWGSDSWRRRENWLVVFVSGLVRVGLRIIDFFNFRVPLLGVELGPLLFLLRLNIHLLWLEAAEEAFGATLNLFCALDQVWVIDANLEQGLTHLEIVGLVFQEGIGPPQLD